MLCIAMWPDKEGIDGVMEALSTVQRDSRRGVLALGGMVMRACVYLTKWQCVSNADVSDSNWSGTGYIDLMWCHATGAECCQILV